MRSSAIRRSRARTRSSTATRDGYLDWLKTIHDESHGNADLVAHFFRRAFNLLRQGGAFGLIATNTIGQGDTREHRPALDLHARRDDLRARTRRTKWPGAGGGRRQRRSRCTRAPLPRAVSSSTAQPCRSSRPTCSTLAGTTTRRRLTSERRQELSWAAYVLGMGFTFDDTDTNGVATPIAEMHELIAKDPRNAERIFPYIGGEEVNDSPTHAHHRYVINFGEMTEEEASSGLT